MKNTANNTKGVLFTEDMRVHLRVPKERCITIHKYDYTLDKSRNEEGEPYGTIMSGSTMDITMCIGSRDSLKVFYERLSDFEPTTYSVIFDALFDDNDNLESYYSAFVVTGFIVSVTEDQSTMLTEEGEYIHVTVRFLIKSLTVMGEGNSVTYSRGNDR